MICSIRLSDETMLQLRKANECRFPVPGILVSQASAEIITVLSRSGCTRTDHGELSESKLHDGIAIRAILARDSPGDEQNGNTDHLVSQPVKGDEQNAVLKKPHPECDVDH
jgi:hypothetical protein